MQRIKEDLTGRRFGYLKVLSHEVGKGWKCQCDCGNTCYAPTCYLTKGRVSSCGCKKYEHNKYTKHPKRGHSVCHSNIIGTKYGHLTVIEYIGYRGSREFFKCECDCGNVKDVEYYKLITGHTKSCGASYHKSKYGNLKGKRFGRLVAIRPVRVKGSSGAYWEFKCDCGTIKNIPVHNILVSGIKSCGCLRNERNQREESKTRLHHVWANMKGRCHNSKIPEYKHYGGRGIKVCNEWQNYEPFKEWALNNGYRDDLTIERINVNGDYCPQNCRWATYKEQGRNKRTTLLYPYKGEVITLIELAEITNLSYDSIHHHYHNNDLEGWLRSKGY